MLDSLLFWTYFGRLLNFKKNSYYRLLFDNITFWKKKITSWWRMMLHHWCKVNFIMHVGIFHFSSLASLMFPLTFFTEKSATKIMMRSNSNNSITGCSLSERFILLSIKPNYDNRFFLDLLKFTQTTVLKSGIQTWNLNPKFQNNACKSM